LAVEVRITPDPAEFTRNATSQRESFGANALTQCSDVSYPKNHGGDGKRKAGSPISNSDPSEQEGP
jgi:hypothetical protein